jgi:hypothetical protein
LLACLLGLFVAGLCAAARLDRQRLACRAEGGVDGTPLWCGNGFFRAVYYVMLKSELLINASRFAKTGSGQTLLPS